MINNNHQIYLDASATTPADPEVIRTVAEVQKTIWGNPSSLHFKGIEAMELLERSRNIISNCIFANPEEIIFTSGARVY